MICVQIHRIRNSIVICLPVILKAAKQTDAGGQSFFYKVAALLNMTWDTITALKIPFTKV